MTGDKEPSRAARIGALTDHQRHLLLSCLCGYAPQAVDAALDVLGYAGPAAAQSTEARDG
jgi:hypothetical protein